MQFETILAERRDSVGLITLNRPKSLNLLTDPMIGELGSALDMFEDDSHIGAMVLTGGELVFSAGTDAKEMTPLCPADVFMEKMITEKWLRPDRTRKPLIAAVAGYATGGGYELAMMCDFIIAGDTAKFSLPEIMLGTVPGFGGIQRLARLIGQSKAMEMCLTGRIMEAVEAESSGLVSRMVAVPRLIEDALETSTRIAHMSLPVASMVKEAVNRTTEISLAEGIRFERRLYRECCSLEDRQEGINAFLEHRQPEFKNK
ncbi:MAG: enoyl-CoA hydratase-related protein [Pseudomonadota bacterium]|nr:enoyl-CoA hydratase-related protein [Pseudomonadota bacterium]